jgi:hypothetical protein
MLRGGESCEVYDGPEGNAKEKIVVYRIGIERLIQAEVKVVRQNGKSKIINGDSRIKVIDVATTGALFLEVIGRDACAFGWYEAIGVG